MKKLLSVFTILSLFTFTSMAQNNTIAFGMDAVVLSNGFESSNSAFGPSLTFESAIGKKFSLKVKGSYLRDNIIKSSDGKIFMSVNNFETGVNFYPKTVHKGFFIGLDLGYTGINYVVKTDGNRTALNASPINYIGGGLNFGLKTNITNRITFGTTAGAKLMADTSFIDGLLQFTLGANVGYKF